jgi:hypothetical protein
MELSPLVLVRQEFPDRSLPDVRGETLRQLSQSGFASRLPPGGRVAIGVGSRGIANIDVIVRAVVDYWKEQGAKPFVFPAMGSHGAATAAGQADVLAHYGIHDEAIGCKVISQLDVVSLGSTLDGIEAFMDREAFSSDGVMLVGRVKWHTDFAGNIESGLCKMMAIGLGKFAGAQRYHTYAYKLGLEHVIRSVARQVLQSGKILGGLAILEDANHQTARLSAVAAGEIEQREEELLTLVKSWMGRIPVEELDILILDEIGKTISGAGMDTKVVNRGVYGEYNPWPGLPRIRRIFVRDLSPASYGNAVGLGMADVIHDRLLGKVDWTPTQINALTASTPPAIRTPIHFSSDCLCLEKIWTTVGRFKASEVTLAWIRNSLELGTLAMSANLLPQIRDNPSLEVVGAPFEWPFEATGDLPSFASLQERDGANRQASVNLV